MRKNNFTTPLSYRWNINTINVHKKTDNARISHLMNGVLVTDDIKAYNLKQFSLLHTIASTRTTPTENVFNQLRNAHPIRNVYTIIDTYHILGLTNTFSSFFHSLSHLTKKPYTFLMSDLLSSGNLEDSLSKVFWGCGSKAIYLLSCDNWQFKKQLQVGCTE